MYQTLYKTILQKVEQKESRPTFLGHSSNFSVIVNINLPQMLRKAKQADLQHRQFEVIRLFQFAANFGSFVIVGLLQHVLKVIG